MSRNRLSTLPNAIGMLENLKQLRLHTNKIATLPDSMTALTNLEVLTLRDNQIAFGDAPDIVTALRELKTLTLGKNKLKKMSDKELQGDDKYDNDWKVWSHFCCNELSLVSLCPITIPIPIFP